MEILMTILSFTYLKNSRKKETRSNKVGMPDADLKI